MRSRRRYAEPGSGTNTSRGRRFRAGAPVVGGRPKDPHTITTKGTTVTITPSYTELRDKQQKVWSSGDYNKIAAITVPLSEHLVDHVGVEQGSRVLDVATGTGHAALAAARRSASRDGIDYVPELLDIARRRAAAEDLEIDFAQADAEDLPYGDARSTSSFPRSA